MMRYAIYLLAFAVCAAAPETAAAETCPPNANCGVKTPGSETDGRGEEPRVDSKPDAPAQGGSNSGAPLSDYIDVEEPPYEGPIEADRIPVDTDEGGEEEPDENPEVVREKRLMSCAQILMRVGGKKPAEVGIEQSRVDECIDDLSKNRGTRGFQVIAQRTRGECRNFMRSNERFASIPSDRRLVLGPEGTAPLVNELGKAFRYCEAVERRGNDELPYHLFIAGPFRWDEEIDQIRGKAEQFVDASDDQKVIAQKASEAIGMAKRYEKEGRLTDREARAFIKRARNCEARSVDMLRSIFQPQPYVDMVAANGCIVDVMQELRETPPKDPETPVWMWIVLGVMTLALGGLGYAGLIRWGAETDFPGDNHSV